MVQRAVQAVQRCAGPIAVRWWWHVTNAAPLYPALLWIALRAARGKRTPAWAVGLIALCYALSAFPATMAYGAYAAVAYFVYVAIRDRRFAPRVVATTIFATLLGIIIAAPSFIPAIASRCWARSKRRSAR